TFHGRPLVTAQASSRVDLEQLLRGRDTPLVADVRVPALDLTGVGPLGGVVEATAAVRGTSAHPTLQAHLVGRDLQLSELRFATVEAHAAWDGTALTARLDGTQPSGGALRLDASLPAAADAPLHATLTADSFRFAVDDVGRVHRLEGVLAVHLQ